MTIRLIQRDKAVLGVTVDDLRLRVSKVLGIPAARANSVVADLLGISRQAIFQEWQRQRISCHRGLGVLCIAGYEELRDPRKLHIAPIPTKIDLEAWARACEQGITTNVPGATKYRVVVRAESLG